MTTIYCPQCGTKIESHAKGFSYMPVSAPVIDVAEKSQIRRVKFHKVMGAKRWTDNEEETLKNLPKITSSLTLDLGRQWGRTPRAIWQRYYKLKRNVIA